MVSEGSFFEEDEPVQPLLAAFDAGVMQLGDVARDDEQEPVRDVGPCEFARGWHTSRQGQPKIQLCGNPGRLRGIAFACDDCWDRHVRSR